PPITSLTTVRELGGLPVIPSSWVEPFQELLLLKIIDHHEDSNTRNQKFCFQHTHDRSELSDVFLCLDVNEGAVRYSIDLRTFHFLREHQARTWVMQLEENCQRCLDYCNRLIENDILPRDSSSFGEVDLFTCPLCQSGLRICEECKTIVTCSNHDCEGLQDIEQCSDYSICHKCLHSAKSPDEFHFVQCPSCNFWSCDDGVPWCRGYILHPELSAEELVKRFRNRESGNESVVRSHPRTPGSCTSCIDSGHANAWQTCSSVIDDTFSHCPESSCPECILEHKGRRCLCGAVWTCDICLVDYFVDPDPRYPKLISCPRCGTDYCIEGCRYCHFCSVCQCTSICVGCQTSEGDVGGEDMPGKILQPSSTVEGCLQYGVKQCSGCQGWLCQTCASIMQRDRCIPCSQNA
ncbi:hypothetical protein V8E55_002364, partial [Tylopilus felleus]